MRIGEKHKIVLITPDMVFSTVASHILFSNDKFYMIICHTGNMFIRAGQFWVIISDFFLQLNLCVCYRENHFRPITDLCRTLLTPARSHIWRVNKLTRENSSLKFSTLPRVHNEHVPWFQDPMLSK